MGMNEYIFLDLEWNQPEDPRRALRRHVRLSGEIIQIGAVKTDHQLNILDTFEIPVRTDHYKHLTPRLQEILPITEEEFADAAQFQIALRKFKKWCGLFPVFFAWGEGDEVMLRNNKKWHGNDSPFCDFIIDAQYIFNRQILHDEHQVSLEAAADMLDETPMPAHDALCDAQTMLMICRHLDLGKGIQQYKSHRKVTDALKFEPRIYETRREALESPELKNFTCPYCGKELSCGDWVNQKNDRKMIAVECENCHRYLVRVKFVRQASGSVYTKRSITPMTEELEAYYAGILAAKGNTDSF